MIVEPKVKGFLCVTAHPEGCAENVREQIAYVRGKGEIKGGCKSALIIGSSTGYGLASRITAAFGCGAAIATSSMATEMIKGKSVDEALKLTNKAVVEALDGLPPQKLHCSVLAEEAVKAAIADYYDKKGIAHDLHPHCDGCCDACAKEH